MTGDFITDDGSDSPLTDPIEDGERTDSSEPVSQSESQSSFPASLPLSVLDSPSAWFTKYANTFDKLNILHRNNHDEIVAKAENFLQERPAEEGPTYSIRKRYFTYSGFMGQAFAWFRAYLFQKLPDISYLDPRTKKQVTVSKPDIKVDPKVVAMLMAPPSPVPGQSQSPTANQNQSDSLSLAPVPEPVAKPVAKPVPISAPVPAPAPEPTGPTLDDFYADFRSDCDGAGTSLDEFMGRATEIMLRLQCAWVLLDTRKPEQGEQEPVSEAHVEELGLNRPYLSIFQPTQILSYGEDRYGKLTWVKIKKVVRKPKLDSDSSIPSFLREQEKCTQWWFYDTTRWACYERRESDDSDVVERQSEGTHSLSEQKQVPWFRLSAPYDYWLGNRILSPTIRHINYENQIAWLSMYCMYPVPVFTNVKDKGSRTLSEWGAVYLPSPNSKFEYVMPSADAITVVSGLEQSEMEKIFSLMFLKSQGRSSANSPSVQSGIAKLREMTPSYEVSSLYGSFIRGAMVKILTAVSAIRGDDYIPTVQGFLYLDSGFEYILDEEIKGATVQILSPTYLRARMRMVIRIGMRNSTQEEVDRALAEVEVWATDAVLIALIKSRVPVAASVRGNGPEMAGTDVIDAVGSA